MKNIIKNILLLVVSLMPLFSQRANATTATAPLLVSATVLSVCGVAATALLFGNYSATNTSPTDATATVTAVCTSGVAYTVALDAGVGTGATVASRVMLFGSDKLNYLLYSDAARTVLWGDGTLSTSKVSGTAALLPQTYTVYGRIPTAQQTGAGLYGDTVTVTLTY
jgi:spore coat protein U-like protein